MSIEMGPVYMPPLALLDPGLAAPEIVQLIDTDGGALLVSMVDVPQPTPAGPVGNHPPVADDDSYNARPGQTLTVPAPGFLDGDTDPDGDPIVADLITDNVDHGTVTAFPDGRFVYKSDPGFTGTDSFSYRINDGFGGTDIGTVTINVLNKAPVADDDFYIARPGQTLSVAAPGFLDGDTDPDGDPVFATLLVDNVDHGTVSAFPDGHFSYKSDPGFVGVDSFKYRISDGFGGTAEATVFIDVQNKAPVADDDVYATPPGITLSIAAPGFLDGDTDPDGDPVFATLITDNVDHGLVTAFPDGSFKYVPDAGFTGVDSFEYRISDGFGGTDTGRVTIHVTNDPVFEVFRIGDAPTRQTGTGGQWLAAWTDPRVDLLHKNDHLSPVEPWTAVVLHGAGSSQLAGGDIFQGDLGVSGVSQATSSVPTEIDGKQVLRFDLHQTATQVNVKLARLFANDDGTLFSDAGVLRLLDAMGNPVAEQAFHGMNASGELTLSASAATGFVAVELIAGVYNGGGVAHGAYSKADGSFGTYPFADANGLHGSDFMVDWIEFNVLLVGLGAGS